MVLERSFRIVETEARRRRDQQRRIPAGQHRPRDCGCRLLTVPSLITGYCKDCARIRPMNVIMSLEVTSICQSLKRLRECGTRENAHVEIDTRLQQ